MGENADDIIEGAVCDLCGVFLAGIAPGYPRRCTSCGGTTAEIACDDDDDDYLEYWEEGDEDYV